MIVTYFGIILFEISEWVKFIKSRSPVTQAESLQVTGREIAYTCLRQRHEICMWHILVKLYCGTLKLLNIECEKPLGDSGM